MIVFCVYMLVFSIMPAYVCLGMCVFKKNLDCDHMLTWAQTLTKYKKACN